MSGTGIKKGHRRSPRKAASREGVSPRVGEAAIDKAAGNYPQCLLKASAEFAKKENED
jgi:hypothetical protein